MSAFFDLKEVSKIDVKNPKSCTSCGLFSGCLSPRMKPYGKMKKGVLFLGEAPGEIEDKRGKPWQGRVGRLLQRTLKGLKFDLFYDGMGFNAVNCRPQENETPHPNHIYCCRRRVNKVINQYNPHVIILLGNIPVSSVIGSHWKKKVGGISKWRGFCIPDRKLNAWICPVYHPSFVSRKEERGGDNLALTIWKKDLAKALQLIDTPLPKYREETNQIKIIDFRGLLKELPKILNSKLMSFDYETTGVKPHWEGQELLTTSIAYGPGEDPEDYTSCAWINTQKTNRLFVKILKSKVTKTAHNIQFEDAWSNFKLKTKVSNWGWCSMNAAHILDNRKGVTGLKFQTYVHFGVPDYDSHISKYLESPKKEGATFGVNKLKQLLEKRPQEVLTYNALDSIFGYKLTLKQMKEMGISL